MTRAMLNHHAVTIVIDLPHLADKINGAHREVAHHGRSMLFEARRAGEYLLKAKEQVRHGEFKAWIEKNCECSYQSAAVYMKVAKEWDEKSSVLDFSTASLRDFVGNKTKGPPEPTLPTFDRTDAEHVMKLCAMVERGGTRSEQEVALKKLEDFAGRFGMKATEAADIAAELLPDRGKTREQAELEAANAEAAAAKQEAAALRRHLELLVSRTGELQTECSKLSREELEERYIGLVLEREGYTKLPSKKAA